MEPRDTSTPPRRRPRSRAGAIWGLLIGAVAVIAIIWMAAQAGDSEPERELVERISDEPAAFDGRFITVRGEVEDVVGPGSFTIRDDDLFENNQLLVLAPDGRTLTVGEDDEVQVSGNVVVFDLARVERELTLDLDDDLYIDWVGRPVLMATSISEQVAARQ